MTSNENQGKTSNQNIGSPSTAVAFRGEKLETGSARINKGRGRKMQSSYFFFSFERSRFYWVIFFPLSLSFPFQALPQWRRSSENTSGRSTGPATSGIGRETRRLPAFRSSPLTVSLKLAGFGAPHHLISSGLAPFLIITLLSCSKNVCQLLMIYTA